MGKRIDLQNLLESILGSKAVYFQPPATIKMTYPCIVYQRTDFNTNFANNYPYRLEKEYTITVIDRDPDSIIPDKIAMLQSCVFNRFYVADNLNHNVFSIYF